MDKFRSWKCILRFENLICVIFFVIPAQAGSSLMLCLHAQPSELIPACAGMTRNGANFMRQIGPRRLEPALEPA
jgi:hypothetical protein